MEDLPFDIGCARFLSVETMYTQLLSCQKGDCMQDACMSQFHLRLRFSVGVRVCDCGGESCNRRNFTRCITVEVPRGMFRASDFTSGRFSCDMASFRIHEARGTATLCVTMNLPCTGNTACISDCGSTYNTCASSCNGCGTARNTCTCGEDTWHNNGFWYLTDGTVYQDSIGQGRQSGGCHHYRCCH